MSPPSASYKRLILVDNSLKNTVGHHYEYAKAVRDEALKRGAEVVVACHRNASPEVVQSVRALPVFRWSVYDRVLDQSRFGVLAKLVNGIASNWFLMFDWIAAQGRFKVDAGTLIFVPNCMPVMVFSFLLWLKMYRNADRPRIVLFFRRDPTALVPFVGKLMSAGVVKGDIVLTTDSDELAQAYRRIIGLGLTVLPIPHLPSLTVKAFEPHRPIRLTYLGDARMEKGIDVLVRAIPYLKRELAESALGFTIQCHAFVGEAEIPKVIAELEEAETQFRGAVVLLRKSLSTAEYYKLLTESDAIIVPYRKSEYQARTSGILAEAIAAGKPVVVTDQTWMSGQLRKHGAGKCFNDDDPSDLARAVRELINNFDSLAEQARIKSVDWCNIHNASRLLDELSIGRA